MARVVKDRIKQTSTTTGTGTVTLSASVAGYQNFSVLGDGNTTFYCIEDANGTAFEVGIGTYTSNTLARTTILDSTNSGSAISLTSGTHDVFVTYPAGRAGFNDEGLSPTLTASGTITAGKPVIQNTNGTVTQVAETTTGQVTEAITSAVNSNNPANKSLTATDGNGTIVQFYAGTSGNPTIQAGTISGTTITWGTAVITQTQDTNGFFLYYDPQGYFVTGSRNSNSSQEIRCFTYTVSGTTLTQASFSTLTYSETGHENLIGGYHKEAQKGLIVTILSSGTNRTFMNTLTVASNGSMTFGSTATDTYRVYSTPQLVYNDEQQCLMLYASAVVPSGGGDWYQPSVMCFTISGSTPSMGTPVQIATSGQTGEYGYLIYHAESKKTLAFYEFYDGSSQIIHYQVVGISGTTVTAGTSTYVGFAGRISNAIVEYTNIGVYEPFTKKIGIAYVDGTDGTTLRIRSATLTNDTLTFDGEVTPSIAPAYNVSMLNLNSSDSKTFLIGSQSNSQTKYNVWTIGSAGVTSSNLNSTNFFGIASNSATTTNPVQINVPGSINNAQTGLTVDKDYYVTDAGLIKERTTTTTTPDANPTFNFQEASTNSASLPPSLTYEATSGTFVAVWKEQSNGYGYAMAGTWSNGTMTWGTPTAFKSSSIEDAPHICSGGGAIHITYRLGVNGITQGGTISGTAITFYGDTKNFATGDDYGAPMGYRSAYDTANNYVIVFFSGSQVATQTSYVIPMHYSASNSHASKYTAGTTATVKSSLPISTKTSEIIYDPDTQRCVVFYRDTTQSNAGYANVIQSTGSSSSPTVTVGSASQFTNTDQVVSNKTMNATYDTQNDKIFMCWANTDGTTNSYRGAIITVTGGSTNTLSANGWADIWDYGTSNNGSYASAVYDENKNNIIFYYRDDSNSDYLTYKTITSGSSSFTVANGSVIQQSNLYFSGIGSKFASGKGIVLITEDESSSSKVSSATTYYNSTTSTVVNGSVFAGTALSATALELKTFPASTIVGKADGAVTKGKPVIVEADGDFAQAKTTTNNISFSKGSETSIQASVTSTYVFTSYNTAQNKFACFYEDRGASSYLYGNVITNDGTTLTAGSKSSAGNNFNTRILSVIYIGDSKHIIFMRNDDNNYFAAVVATVSGTSISYGTVNTFHSYSNHFRGTAYWDSDKNVAVFVGCYNSSSKNLAAYSFTVSGTTLTKTAGPVDNVQGVVNYVDSAYDSTNKIGVVAYTDGSDDGYVTTLSASSAGALTWNTAGEAQISGSDNLAYSGFGMTYDSVNEKTILIYKNETTNLYGYTVPITLSGNPATTVAIGSASDVTGVAVFSNDMSAIATDYGAIAYTYIQNSVYSYIKYKQGDASGSTISISGADNLVTGADYFDTPPLAFNPTDNVIAGAYRDGSDDDVDAVAFIASGSVSSSNLTAENYIGIAQETVSTGNDVKVTTISGVDANQSSLTPAQIYYVQTDGTLSTTAGSPSVVAGTAIAATQLLVSRS